MTAFRENEKGQFEPAPPDPARDLLKRILNEVSWVDFREADPQQRLGHVRDSYLSLDGAIYHLTDEEVALIKELIE